MMQKLEEALSIVDEGYLTRILNSIQYENRFFPDESFNIILSELLKMKSATFILDENQVLYRGRLYKSPEPAEDPPKGAAFHGYGPKGSGVNMTTQWATAGRMNPTGIKVLYLATGETTCAKEIGAAAGDIISIAKFSCVRSLHIVDFRGLMSVRDKKKKLFASQINDLLSTGHSEADYVLSQYLAMLCKSKGFDGIKYRSKYCTKQDVKKGFNIAIFDPELCTAISSDIRTVKSISLSLL